MRACKNFQKSQNNWKDSVFKANVVLREIKLLSGDESFTEKNSAQDS